MRIKGTHLIDGALLAVALVGAIGLTSELPPADEDPAPEPTPTVTEYVTVTEPTRPTRPTRPTHPCHEDEAAVVTPYGLACVPVDDLQPDRDLAERAITESGRMAYWPSEYDIAPRNAPDTDPGE